MAQTSGTIAVAGLSAPVRIARDRWGVPHIYATSQDDLFFAQGFVQAQDRLFQMDLWRRAAQGRLSEVLGVNFIERDAMTRRIQYRGDAAAEWASYGPDAQSIGSAFVRGINAWVAVARDRAPDEFRLAGWLPEFWSVSDLINRTDVFLAGGDARQEVVRARAMLESPRRADVPRGLDLATVSDVIDVALRRVGTPPFFVGFASPLTPPDRSVASVRPAPAATSVPSATSLPNPSLRYLVHLNAPGWNVVGATPPWRPGVTVGHNERVAWDMTPFAADTQDLFVERVNPSDPHQVEDRGRWIDTRIVTDTIVIKRRAQPLSFEIETTPRGVVIASDRERHLAFVLRWSGSEPGASELAALALNRAESSAAFLEGLARWKLPTATFTSIDATGTASRVAGVVPVRRGWNGALPVPAWTNDYEWSGWQAAVRPVENAARPETASPRVLFAHPLAIDAEARQRFNAGPFEPAPPRPAFGLSFDAADWDRSTAMNAPGQSESPDSAHFSDLAALWAKGASIPLWFSSLAVQANTAATLILEPRRP